ncbi:hypothetical protein Q6A86_09620 [Aliarcobacter skirrowii]|uniref:hypothetical protein n=1 Tax=Aliarcobacter skirrowii TaxID=28200 RepID=UPI0029B1905B|nr:hypothetical protein [Aliarcobacter skirrowii]MDX4013242.1 hypothetical protein [Aliarcobacter skirrowii]
MKLIFFLYFLSISVFAISLNEQTIMDISRTYGYTIGQNYTLDKIREKYPKLSNDILIVKSELDTIQILGKVVGKVGLI